MKLDWRVAVAITVCFAILVGCGVAATGEPGVGIDYIVNNGDGTFTMFLTDGSSHTTDDFTGPQGPQGNPGPPGPVASGFDTLAYNMSLDTYFTCLSSVLMTDLPDSGSVSVDITSGRALVIITGYIETPMIGFNAQLGFRVSGATTRDPDGTYGLILGGHSIMGAPDQAGFTRTESSAMYVIDWLNNGINSFHLQYYTSGEPVCFENWGIIVIPLP